jgi:hypothetical protein
VGTNTTDTLTNKTLTSPIINNATLTLASFTLATSGGTASTLNYYEEWASSGYTIGGPFANQNLNVKITRIGKICTLYIQGKSIIATNATAIMTVNTAIPARFYPADSNLRFVCSAISNNVYVTGHIEVSSSTGVITAYSDLNAGTFPTASFAALHPTSFSYLCA